MAGFAFDAAVLGLIICLFGFSDDSGSAVSWLKLRFFRKYQSIFCECDDWDRGFSYLYYLSSLSSPLLEV